jgi:hypothetical protein
MVSYFFRCHCPVHCCNCKNCNMCLRSFTPFQLNRDRSPTGKWIDISPPKTLPLLAIHKTMCRSLVRPAHVKAAAAATTTAQATCRLVPRACVRGFSSPAAGSGEHVLSVEAVDGAEQGHGLDSPQAGGGGSGMLRDSVRIPICYHTQASYSVSTPFDPEGTRFVHESTI